MQRRLFSTILAIGAIAVLMAATPVQSRAVPQDAAAELSADTLVFAALTVDDLALLKKAADAVQKTSVLIRSDVQARLRNRGVVVSLNENMKVMGHFPDKFRSEVTVLEEDGKTTAASFLVTNDGTNLTTYRSTTREYGVQESQAFKGNPFAFVTSVGIIGGTIASGPSWGLDETAITPDILNAVMADFKTKGLSLVVAPGKNGQKIFEVKQGDPDANGFRLRLAVEPLTGSFVAAQQSGTFGDWKFTVTETIRSLAKLSDTAVGNFNFQAPAEAKKIDKVSIWPF